jgi:hypothetical protein
LGLTLNQREHHLGGQPLLRRCRLWSGEERFSPLQIRNFALEFRYPFFWVYSLLRPPASLVSIHVKLSVMRVTQGNCLVVWNFEGHSGGCREHNVMSYGIGGTAY